MSAELLEDLIGKLEALRVGQVGAVMLKFHGKVIYAHFAKPMPNGWLTWAETLTGLGTEPAPISFEMLLTQLLEITEVIGVVGDGKLNGSWWEVTNG